MKKLIIISTLILAAVLTAGFALAGELDAPENSERLDLWMETYAELPGDEYPLASITSEGGDIVYVFEGALTEYDLWYIETIVKSSFNALYSPELPLTATVTLKHSGGETSFAAEAKAGGSQDSSYNYDGLISEFGFLPG